MKNIAITLATVAIGLSSAASASTSAQIDASTAIVAEPTVYAPELAGRWFWFFGARLCAGQVVYLPGESQCV